MSAVRDYIEKLNELWSEMNANGMRDSLANITQLSYLVFLKRIDTIHSRKEAAAALFGMEIPDPIFGPLDESCRWSVFKTYPSDKMFRNMTDKVLPFIRYSIKMTAETSYARYLKNTGFLFTNPDIFRSAVETIDSINFEDAQISNECYEYLLSMIRPNSEKGQFRTPPHLVELMVALTNPGIDDKICDPASGTGSFLVNAARTVYQKHQSEMIDQRVREYFESDMLSGFDIDSAMTDIAAMNLSLAGVTGPNLQTMDSLSAANTYSGEFSLVLSNPPFNTTTDPDYVAESLQTGFPTSNTAVLFFRLIMRLLRPEGRCAVIIPDNLLFGVHRANMALKQELVENHRIDAIIALTDPDVPYFGNTSCSILLLTKDVPNEAGQIWYYNLSSSDLVGDLIYRFEHKDAEAGRTRYDNSFLVPVEEIVQNNYMLIMQRYQKNASLPTHGDVGTAVQNLEIANSILRKELFDLDTIR